MKLRSSILYILFLAFVFSALVLAKSILEFSHTGPEIQEQVMAAYKGYTAYALARLLFWLIVISALCIGLGIAVYGALRHIFGWRYRWYLAGAFGYSMLGSIVALQFLRHLLEIPSSLIASWNYRISRLYPLWDQLSPELLSALTIGLFVLVIVPIAFWLIRAVRDQQWGLCTRITALSVMYMAILIGAWWQPEPAVAVSSNMASDRPNVIMIGADTLRADRIGGEGYSRDLTPNIDALAQNATVFRRAYVPLARTSASLTTMFTGTWPHTHGVRSNYIPDSDTTVPGIALAEQFRQAGYQTAAVADWAGGDLGKLNFGFELTDLPEDQWNLKYLLRQGPKDIRLLLSLFTHNHFGRTFLPEIYYLAGVPLTQDSGRLARVRIAELAKNEQPFFLNMFVASTHAPFGSEYPYYTLFTDKNYGGESRFVMAGLNSVKDIVDKQEQDKRAFDVQQITNLYDGAVRSFDAEVGRIVDYLNASGLLDNTIIVIYSDHGVDLFEGETWGQGNIMSDHSYRVPLVIFDPYGVGGNEVVDTVRTVDLAPTLLDLADVAIPVHMEGVSLKSAMHAPDSFTGLPVFAETGLWIGKKIRGLPEDRIQYPNILNLLEIRDYSTGTLSIKSDLLDTIIEAKARILIEDGWQMDYFPLNSSVNFSLTSRDQTTPADDNKTIRSERMQQKLVSWIRADKDRVWCEQHLRRHCE